MQVTEQHLDLIKKWEGLRLEAYLPTPNDVWTIGYGHTRGVRPGMVITEAQAEAWLKKEVQPYAAAVDTYISVPLNRNQHVALTSWVYNVGIGSLKSSTLRKKLNSGDYQGAADELLRWDKQKGKTLKGLSRRRREERELFLSATTQVPTTTAERGSEGLLALFKAFINAIFGGTK